VYGCKLCIADIRQEGGGVKDNRKIYSLLEALGGLHD